jgi:hypothetical protein
MKDINMASSKDGIDKSAIDEIRLMQVLHVHLRGNMKCPLILIHTFLSIYFGLMYAGIYINEGIYK